jgi:broad specificity phosphatase PhoE
MPPKFVFLRHGEAEHNVAFHAEGVSAFSDPKYADARLTEKGILQAREVGKKLSSLNFVDIWSSPLTRCIQTSLEIFEEIDAQEINLHDNLLERQDYREKCNSRKIKPELLKEFGICKMGSLPDFPPTWIKPENNYAMHQRMYMMVMLLANMYEEENENSHILIVSHAQAIAELTGHSLKNAEYVVLSLNEIS